MPIHTLSNPFVPRSSIIRYPNGIFELRLHVHGVPSEVQLVAHDNYVLVTGRIVPRARIDVQGRVSTLLWSDYPCGYFGRDIPLNLNASTEVLILERRQEAEDLVIRYTLRPKAIAYSCGPSARVDQFSARPYAQPVYNDAFATSHYTCGKGAACTCGPQQVTQIPYALSTGAPVAYGASGYYTGAPINHVAFPQAVTAETAGVNAGFSAHLGNVEVGANIGASEGVTLKEGVATVI